MRLRPVRSGIFSPLCPPYSSRPRRGYTLLEILIATTLALMLMAAVTQLLGQLGTSINNSRAILETADSLRAAATRLQLDLDGVTVTMMPPRRVESNEGYFELINGTGLFPPSTFVDSSNNNQPDSSFAYSDSTGRTLGTVGNVGNILMFTTHDAKRPFVGRYTTSYGFIDSAGNLWRAPVVTAIQSDTAEVAWFMRGHNLHRRVLLVVPQATTMLEWGFRQQMNVSSPPPLPPPFYAADTLSNSVSATSLYIGGGFFAFNDISVHAQTKGVPVPNYLLVPNTLGDLTRRECRYAHPTDVFPYDASRWGQLGLPTLYESTGTATSWLSCYTPPATMPRTLAQIDLWSNNPQYNYTDYELLLQQPITYPLPHPPYQILSSDVVLSNVIGFDVKVWDPGAGAYVNLGAPNAVTFAGNGSANSKLGTNGVPVYDTWSTSYDAMNGPGTYSPGQAYNGMDDLGSGIVDSPGESATTAPYPAPLRGIQIKIRVFEPDSRTIREVTVIQNFLPK